MKIDLTNLPIEIQAAHAARILRQRLQSGQKTTHADDLMDCFKHRGLGRHRAQWVKHCNRLLHLGALLATGKDATKALKDARAESIIYQPGDQVIFGDTPVRVLDVLPDNKLRILSLAGERILRTIDVRPVISSQ